MRATRTAVVVATLTALVLPTAAAHAAGAGPTVAEGARAATSRTAPPKPLVPRLPGVKPLHTKLFAGQSRDVVRVKFAEGSGIRLRNGKIVSLSGRDLAAVHSLLAGSMASAEPVFSLTEQQLTADAAQAEAASGRQQADLNLYLSLRLRPGADAAALIDRLNALGVVEIAYPAPLPSPLPLTPDFTPRQSYRTAASSNGIDADYASTVAGGTGSYVRVHDVEYSWDGLHEDLSKLQNSMYANGTPLDPFDDNHGTAVIGEIAGDRNGLGVTGLVPDATIQVTNTNTTTGFKAGNAVLIAASHLVAGDVMLIEQQTAGANGGCGASQVGCVAEEYLPEVYDAVVQATSKGIIVLEAAGNGSQNLDGAEYGTSFPSGKADSGAIIVGAGGSGLAGCSLAHSRMDFSSYGSRVNLQGWGECVTTTGYGYLQGGLRSQWYTAGFSGTSSATPIVASAAAALSSVAKARGMLLTPRDVRARLVNTGTAQTYGLSGHIGPLPNLRAAIAGLTSAADTTAPSVSKPASSVPPGYSVSSTVPVSTTWSASDPSGIAAYAVYLQINGGSWVQQTTATPTTAGMTLSMTPGSTYAFAVAAKDGAGNWSQYSYGPTFGVGMWQENSGYVSYSTGWTATPWTSASGGYLDVSSTAGASASFTFTGRNVAWIGTKSTNRGQAYVYLDGTYVKTVDLYAATTQARAVLASYVWPTSGTHTMKVVVVGTSGRPSVDVDAFVRLS